MLPLNLPFNSSNSIPKFIFVLVSQVIFLFPFLEKPNDNSLLLLLIYNPQNEKTVFPKRKRKVRSGKDQNESVQFPDTRTKIKQRLSALQMVFKRCFLCKKRLKKVLSIQQNFVSLHSVSKGFTLIIHSVQTLRFRLLPKGYESFLCCFHRYAHSQGRAL